MNKFLLSAVVFFSAICGTISADPYAFAWNRCCQTIECGCFIAFEDEKSHFIDLDECGKVFDFDEGGNYLITYTAVGSAVDCENDPIPGEWYVYLELNEEDVAGGDVCVKNAECSFQEATGQAIVHINKHDEVRLRVCGHCEHDVHLKQATIVIHRL